MHKSPRALSAGILMRLSSYELPRMSCKQGTKSSRNAERVAPLVPDRSEMIPHANFVVSFSFDVNAYLM